MNAPKFADLSLVTTLMGAVRDAIPEGGTERDVITFISRPMWDQWCHDLGEKTGIQPTDWNGAASHQIYGSKTIVIEGTDKFFAISRARQKPIYVTIK